MPRWSARLFVTMLVLSLCVVVVGCAKKPPPEPVDTQPPAVATPPPPAEEIDDSGFAETTEEPSSALEDMDSAIARLNAQGVLGTIYFEFDKSELRADAISQLKQNADWLMANGQYRVRIEGHCDERGTVEYNLALGDRRAVAAREYLVRAGIDAGRLEVISFGEEHPAEMGHNEAAWSKNRRAEFIITK